MRAPVLVLLLFAALACAGCGGGHSASTLQPSTVDEPGFEADEPALSLLPDSQAAKARLLERLGHRRDFRVPRPAVRDTRPGPLAWAVIARMWNEIDVPDPQYGRLNAGQRALFALQWADYEILDGGFDQFWSNSAGWFGAELVAAARRVGAPEYERVFRDAAALFPGGRVPRERASRQHLIEGFPERAGEFFAS